MSTGDRRLTPSHGFSRARHLERRSARALTATVWVSADGLRVLSDLVRCQLPGQAEGEIGWQWLVSASRNGRDERPTDDDLRRVIDAFGMPAHDEDNHHPGVARHLWCPLDPEYRSACECKLTETLVVEPDGYEWSNDESDGCRGCELERTTGLPCTVHHLTEVDR